MTHQQYVMVRTVLVHPLRMGGQHTGQAPCAATPIDIAAMLIEPAQVGQAELTDRIALEELALTQCRLVATELDQRLTEPA